MNLADALVSKKFKDGECVIQQVRCLEMLKVIISYGYCKCTLFSWHPTSAGGWHWAFRVPRNHLLCDYL